MGKSEPHAQSHVKNGVKNVASALQRGERRAAGSILATKRLALCPSPPDNNHVMEMSSSSFDALIMRVGLRLDLRKACSFDKQGEKGKRAPTPSCDDESARRRSIHGRRRRRSLS